MFEKKCLGSDSLIRMSAVREVKVVTPDKKQTQCPYLYIGWVLLSLLFLDVGGEEENVMDAANKVLLHHTPHQQDLLHFTIIIIIIIYYWCWCRSLTLKESTYGMNNGMI